MKKGSEYINPEGMLHSPAFSQAVMAGGHGKMLFIGGQNAVDTEGKVIGKGDLRVQTERVMQQLEMILKACDATFADLIKLNIYLVAGQDARQAYQYAQPFLSGTPGPPAVTVLFVPALGNADFLLEVDGVAFVRD